jgi:8-hydroxy-5-deazaflavin:NADPH oxidoreductase
MHVGIIGGTGHEGRALAARLASAGFDVLVGSRAIDRAQATVAELHAAHPVLLLRAATNRDVVSSCDVVFLSVAFAGAGEILDAHASSFRAGTLVIDVTVPLAFRDGVPTLLEVAEGSAAAFVRARLPREVRLAAAFKTIPASILGRLDSPLECDEFVCGESPEIVAETIALLSRVPTLRLVDAGGLEAAATLERMTALAVAINKRYRKRSARFRVVGI